MKKILIGLFIVTLIGLLGGQVMAEAKPDIKELIKELGKDEERTRNIAYNRLIETGKELINSYRQAKIKKVIDVEEVNNLKKEIAEFALLFNNARQDVNQTVKEQASKIRRYFYDLTKPQVIFWLNNKTYIIDTDGTNQKPFGKRGSHDPAWSPDGTKIAFYRGVSGCYGLCVMDVDGNNFKQITDDHYANHPAWSPDGIKLAFISQNKLFIAEADGKNRKLLVEPIKGTGEDDPAWSPDGTRIAFRSTRPSAKTGNIWIVNIDGSNLKKLSNGLNDSCPAWSPDGTKIVFVSRRIRVVGKEYSPYCLYVMDQDGKNQRQLTEYVQGLSLSDPAWSPDDTKIICGTCLDGHRQICLMDRDGKNPKYFASYKKQGYYHSFTWKPTSLEEIFPLFANPD